jgi:hypothetical protein
MLVAASVLEEESQQLTNTFTWHSALLKAAINLSMAEHKLSHTVPYELKKLH